VYRVAALRPNDYLAPDVITGPPRASGTSEPRWLDASPAGRAALPGAGQRPLFPESGTLPTWTKVVSGLGLMGMLYTMDHWARPTLKASKMQRRNGLWGFLQSVVDSLGEFLNHGTNYVGHEVSKGAAHAAHGPAYTIGLGADRWNQLVWNVTYGQLANEHATRQLVHHVIPRQINAQTRPLRARARRLEKGQATQTRKTNALRHWTHTEIVRNVKPRIHHLETVTTKTLPQRIHREELKRGKLETKVRRDHKILMKLLPLLTVAGAVALVTKAFSRMGLNMLRCQNTKDALRDLCASPPGSGRKLGRFLRGILSGLGGLLAPLFICQLFEAAVVLVGPLMNKMVQVVGIVGSALCNGKHSAAPPLALNAAALPPVRDPIPL
jgi:hypothetical protein